MEDKKREGFFDLTELKSIEYHASSSPIAILVEQARARKRSGSTRPLNSFDVCNACGLYKTAKSPKMQPYGNFKRKVLVVGEAPGAEEDAVGKPWQGQAGRLFQYYLRQHGIDLFEDCLCINAVSCRPMTEDGNANRAPTNKEIQFCQRRVIEVIEKNRPNLIILAGSAALTSVVGYRWSGSLDNVTRWHGFAIPDRQWSAWLCPTYHPSFVMRQGEDPALVALWQKDLREIVAHIDKPVPKFEDEEKHVTVLENIEDVKNVLRRLNEGAKFIAIDIESTGIKPYLTEQHRIIALSIASSPTTCYSFLYPNDDHEAKQLIKSLLKNERIGKIAHNMKFEDMWFAVREKIRVRPWIWDTMLAAHILDNRRGVCGLKFQVYVQFGRAGYDAEVQKFLRFDPEEDIGSNANNNIEQLLKSPKDVKMLLTYCGLDSLFTFRLAIKQQREMGVHMAELLEVLK